MTQPNPFRPYVTEVRLEGADLDLLIGNLERRIDTVQVPDNWASELTLTCRSCIACTSTCNGCTNGCTNNCLDDFAGRLGQW